MDIFEKQGREDLATKEKEELAVIMRFLPAQMSEEEITSLYQKTIEACKKGLNADLRIA